MQPSRSFPATIRQDDAGKRRGYAIELSNIGNGLGFSAFPSQLFNVCGHRERAAGAKPDVRPTCSRRRIAQRVRNLLGRLRLRPA